MKIAILFLALFVFSACDQLSVSPENANVENVICWEEETSTQICTYCGEYVSDPNARCTGCVDKNPDEDN